MRLLVCAALVLLAGCQHMQPKQLPFRGIAGVTASHEECGKLDDKVVGMTLTALVAGSLGTAGGAAAPSIDNKPAQWALSGGAALLTALAAATGYLSGVYAKRYANGCTVNMGGR